jgi:hypothetical protein
MTIEKENMDLLLVLFDSGQRVMFVFVLWLGKELKDALHERNITYPVNTLSL